MAAFTDAELTFLRSVRLLGRIATVGTDGMPHVTPVGWSLATCSGRAALVIDEVLPPWRPRGIEIRGRARPSWIRSH